MTSLIHLRALRTYLVSFRRVLRSNSPTVHCGHAEWIGEYRSSNSLSIDPTFDFVIIMEKVQDLLSDLELDHILEVLATSPLEWVGNESWSRQMSMLEQLNVQAAIEADRGGEERVRDVLVENGKIPILIHELLLLELWRLNVLPRILKLGQPKSSFQVNI